MSATSPLTDLLGEYRVAIDSKIEDFFNSCESEYRLQDISSPSKAALTKLHDFSSRPGKRVRGALAAWSYDQATSQHLSQNGLQLAVAVELIQNYLLIVDDVMDRSDMRRGKPAVHKLFGEQHGLNNDEHLANMLAINVGLLAAHLAGLVLASIPEKPDRVAVASAILHRNILSTVFGQVDDLYQHISRNVTENDILRTYYLKSSTYTFVNPLQLGVVLGGDSSPELMNEIDRFGDAAGVAFQLRDDLIGVFGDPKITGKSNLDDIKEGKLTFLMHHALENSEPTRAQELKKYLGNPGFSTSDLEKTKQILGASGSLEFVESKIKFYTKQAKSSVSSSSYWEPTSKEFLLQLVEYVSKREK